MKTHSQSESDSESHDNKRSITTKQIIDDLSEKNIVKNSHQQISTDQQLFTTDQKFINHQAVYFADLEQSQKLSAYLVTFSAGIQHDQHQCDCLHQN